MHVDCGVEWSGAATGRMIPIEPLHVSQMLGKHFHRVSIEIYLKCYDLFAQFVNRATAHPYNHELVEEVSTRAKTIEERSAPRSVRRVASVAKSIKVGSFELESRAGRTLIWDPNKRGQKSINNNNNKKKNHLKSTFRTFKAWFKTFQVAFLGLNYLLKVLRVTMKLVLTV